jgi:hypothetical protein
MDSESCVGRDRHSLLRKVPVVALVATLVGIGASAAQRRHLHEHEHEGVDPHEGRCGGGHGHHHECQGVEGRHGRGDHGPAKGRMSPLQILEKRFASGDIDEDEYRQRRSVLLETVE